MRYFAIVLESLWKANFFANGSLELALRRVVEGDNDLLSWIEVPFELLV